MTRSWLVVILLVIISGTLASRRNITDVDQLSYELLQLEVLFNPQGPEFIYDILRSYKGFFEKLDDTWNMKKEFLRSTQNFPSFLSAMQPQIESYDEVYVTFTQRLYDTANFGFRPMDIARWSRQSAEILLENLNVSLSSVMIEITDISEYYFASPDMRDYSQIIRNREIKNHMCGEKQSPQQVMFNFYNMIVLMRIKTTAMVQFSYTLRTYHYKRTYREEFIKADREYNLPINKVLRTVKTGMTFTSREIWSCDPNVHKEGLTYAKLQDLFQGYIVNEINLNPTQSCSQDCSNYRYAAVHGCSQDQFCSQQRQCNGRIRNCQFIDSTMWICPSENKSFRRYEYIEYKNGRVFGSKKTCHKQTIEVNSSWSQKNSRCSYCMCYCDDGNTSSHRYFSLKETTSNVEKNRVVTGIRLTKVKEVIHLQIQEGELLPRGEILEESVQWKYVDKFTVMDRNVRYGNDYHSLDWENRALDLDDIVAPESHLLTGVAFRRIGTHLHLKIRVTPFNFKTGLLTKTSKWLDATHIKNPTAVEEARTELKLTEPDVPTRSEAPALPDSKSNQYVNFGPTDFEKDAAQTTIPFLDIQPLTTNPPSPLSGAGIFHKGSDGSGGFIALRVITYDISNHLNIDATDTDYRSQ